MIHFCASFSKIPNSPFNPGNLWRIYSWPKINLQQKWNSFGGQHELHNINSTKIYKVKSSNNQLTLSYSDAPFPMVGKNSGDNVLYTHTHIYTHNVVLLAWISHNSLAIHISSVASGRSSRRHPVSMQSCCR